MTTLLNVHLVGPDGVVDEPVDVVFGDTITSIRPTGGPASGDVTDGSGRFLVPGLIDTHVHLHSPDALAASARAGITTLVDLGTHPDALVAELRRGHGVPAILSAGSAASAPGSTQTGVMGFPAESAVTGPDDARRYLDWRVANGSEVIKIIIEDPDATDVPALSPATLTALVDGAHERGLLAIAHVVTAAAFVRGLDAGVDILTHVPLDQPLPEATVLRMLAQHTIASPTLVMMRTMARARLGDHAEAAFANSLASVRLMHAAGVTVIAGTDANETPFAPVAHGSSLHDELGYLQQAGLSAAEALGAATDGAAAALRLADRGRIAEGLRADLVLVDGDPLADPGILRAPAAVWIAGVPAA